MSFNLDAVRAQFPALALTDNGKRRIYFDGPAGTQVPRTVADAMSRCLLEANANVGGKFATSNRADAIVQSGRAAMADLLNAPSPEEVVFGQNMTTLTFHVSRALGRTFERGDEIIVTRMDHDANVWPWVMLARDLGLVIRYLDFDTETYEFDLDRLDGMLSERTRLVCFGAASNLTGTINDTQSICARARSAGALTYVDAVQSVPHIPTDVQALGCDFLVCSSYKFFGPHQGILWGRRDLLEGLEPDKLRPAPERVPGRFETGTQSHESFAGITAAVDYLAWIGETMAGAIGRPAALRAAMSLVFDYEKTLAAHLLEGLAAIDGVTVRGITGRDALDRRVPTVSFTHDRLAPAQIAQALVDENIFVWSGHNYAVELAGTLGLLDSGGVLRVGPVHYNSVEEIDELLDVLQALPGP